MQRFCHLWHEKHLHLLMGILLCFLMGLAACGQVVNPDVCTVVRPSGYPRLAMANGIMYLWGGYSESLYALRMSDGTLQWKYQTGTLIGVDNGIVYTRGLGDILYALHASDGRQIWHYDMSPDVSSVDAVVDGLVYMSSSNSLTMYALRGSDGSRLWQRKIDTDHYPSQFAASNGIVYVALGYSRILTLREADGSQVWQYDTGGKPDGNSFLMKLSNGIVYIVSDQIVALRASDGTVLWHFPQAGSLAEANGITYIASDQLYAVRSSDGQQLWHWQSPSASSGQYTLTLLDGIIYVGPEWQGVHPDFDNTGVYSDHLYALKATDGTLLWDRQLNSSSPASLSAADGKAYLLSADTLDALNANDGKLLWHQLLQQVGLVVSNGVIYAGTAGNANSCFPLTNSKLTALRINDGSQLWHFESGSVTNPSLP